MGETSSCDVNLRNIIAKLYVHSTCCSDQISKAN